MKWEDLPIQEQVRYEEIVSRFHPNLTQEELEKKQKNIMKVALLSINSSVSRGPPSH